MFKVFRRKDTNSKIWQISYTDPSGNRVRKSSGTTDKIDATELARKISTDAWDKRSLNKQPRRLWTEAAEK